jgi:hypothetical protein
VGLPYYKFSLMGVLHYSFGYSFLAINFQTKRNHGFK